MRIAVVGTGYVGLVTATCFAELGHYVTGIDIDPVKIRTLQSGKSTIYEPQLEELIGHGLKRGHLSFTTKLEEVIDDVEMVFSAVATPTGEDHHADLRAVYAVTETVAKHAKKEVILVIKSTVPVGTSLECEKRIASVLKARKAKFDIPVVNNPEFLREGTAVQDTLMPDRVIVGTDGNANVRAKLEELYRPITRIGRPILFMSRESSEVVKYASNSYLATRISFINMLSEFTEKTGGSIRDVAAGMGLDHRIGPRFLQSGVGYGGSCFPKDVKAFLSTAKQHKIELGIIAATDAINQRQRERFFDRVLESLPPKAKVCIWGLSFKPRTDDMRDAPSIDFIRLLLKKKFTVSAFDPFAMENAKKIFPEGVTFAASPSEAAKDAHAVILLTEWDIFRGQEMKKIASHMSGKHFFDGRNIYEPKEVEAAGLTYHCIGVSEYL